MCRLTPWEWRDRHVMTSAGPSSSTVRLVLCGLARFVGKDGDCFPSVKTLCEATALGERSVQTALKDAEVSGWLRRKAEPGHLVRYSPALPGDPSAIVRLGDTPAAAAPPQQPHPRSTCADPRSSRGGGAQQPHPTPAAAAPEGRKEGREKREGKEGPPCLSCSAPTYEQQSKRGPFWGCSRFKTHGCKGRGIEPQDHVAMAAKATAAADAQRAKNDREKRADTNTVGQLAQYAVKDMVAAERARAQAAGQAKPLLRGSA